MPNNKVYKVLDVFAGAGGFSLGFQMAGCDVIGAIEHDKWAADTFSINHPHAKMMVDDIEKLSDEQILTGLAQHPDIIIGGPPCQGFSICTQNAGDPKDPRNSLFNEFLRMARIFKPQAMVMENVPNITNAKTKSGEKVTEIIKKEFSKLGYYVYSSILIASDYGVPQNRNRAVFIGIDKNIGNFDYEQIKKTKNIVTVKEAIGELYDIENKDEKSLTIEPKTKFQKYVRAKNNLILNHKPKYPNLEVQERMKYVPQGGNWQNVPEHLWKTQRSNRHSSAYRRLDESKPSITIDTGHMNYFHPIYNRVPTVRESARLQSFPDDFVFIGTPTSQLRQVGNAVPPLMAKAVAELIKEVLNNAQ